MFATIQHCQCVVLMIVTDIQYIPLLYPELTLFPIHIIIMVTVLDPIGRHQVGSMSNLLIPLLNV